MEIYYWVNLFWSSINPMQWSTVYITEIFHMFSRRKNINTGTGFKEFVIYVSLWSLAEADPAVWERVGGGGVPIDENPYV